MWNIEYIYIIPPTCEGSQVHNNVGKTDKCPRSESFYFTAKLATSEAPDKATLTIIMSYVCFCKVFLLPITSGQNLLFSPEPGLGEKGRLDAE